MDFFDTGNPTAALVGRVVLGIRLDVEDPPAVQRDGLLAVTWLERKRSGSIRDIKSSQRGAFETS